MSIPEQLKYSNALKEVGLKARISRRQYFPESTTSFNTSSRVIRIPIQSPDGMVNTNNSWLRCTASITLADGDTPVANQRFAYLRSAYSFFQRLRILSAGGAVLDEIENFGVVCNALLDAYLPADVRSKHGTAAGFSQSADTASTAFTIDNMVRFEGGAAGAPGESTRQFTIPILMSGLLSLTSGEQNDGHGLLLPLPLMNGIILELTLRDNVNDMVISTTSPPASTTASNFKLENVAFDAEVITYDQSVIQSLRDSVAAAGGKIFLSGSSYHGQLLAANSANPQISINERVRSLKSLYLINQLQDQVGNIQRDFDARVNLGAPGTENNSGSFSILIGSQKYPAQELTFEPTEMMAALAAAGGKPVQGIISRQSFVSQAGATGSFVSGNAVGSALYGLNLESADARAMIESGFDVASGSLPITVQAKFSTGAPRNHIVATHYDAVYIVDVMTKDVQVSF
jgi:hypothetical protein